MKALMKGPILLAVVIMLASSGSAFAFVHPRVVIRPGFVYQPYYWSPYWGPSAYFDVWPSGPRTSQVEVQVTPKQAQVYVDGYYAGIVDDLHGHKVPVTPGGHEITLFLSGYTTLTEQVYVSPHQTFKMRDTMEPLGPGEQSTPVPPPAQQPAS